MCVCVMRCVCDKVDVVSMLRERASERGRERESRAPDSVCVSVCVWRAVSQQSLIASEGGAKQPWAKIMYSDSFVGF